MDKYDLIVVGMGPSSIFLAYELIQKNNAKNVLLIDEGKRVERRYCPVEKAGECLKCKPFCNITSGFSGAGAFSDGKLSLYNKEDEDIYVGGNLHKYIGVEKTKELIDYADNVYLKFGADKHLEGTEYKEEVKKLKKKAQKEDINLIGIPIRHLGTEKSHEIYKKIQDYLEENNIEMMYETVVEDLIIENGKVVGVKIHKAGEEENKKELLSKRVVLAVGRKGADWLAHMCEKYKIKTEPGAVDIGVRYELKDEVMKEVNKYLYEGKFIRKTISI